MIEAGPALCPGSSQFEIEAARRDRDGPDQQHDDDGGDEGGNSAARADPPCGGPR